MTNPGLIFYRVYDVIYETGIYVKIETYKPVKETPCGYWVVSQRLAPSWLTTEELLERKLAKWIHKNAAKSLCYKALKDAFYSFERRKLSQAWRAESSLQQAKLILEKIDKWGDAGLDQLQDGINLGRTEIMDSMNWDY